MLLEFIVGSLACVGLVTLLVSLAGMFMRPRPARDLMFVVYPTPQTLEQQVRQLQWLRAWHLPGLRIVVADEPMNEETRQVLRLLRTEDPTIQYETDLPREQAD